MNKLFKTLNVLAAIALFITACSAQAVQAQSAELAVQAAPKAVTYETVLGKPVNSKDVADFIASNRCTPAAQFQICQSAGLALGTDANGTVQTAYLSINKSEYFAPYRGTLPFGLAASDTMATVEQKFGQPKEVHAPQAGWVPGLPDAGSSPDHIHYWAVYNRFGATIIYNSPSADDKGATIYAIRVSKNP